MNKNPLTEQFTGNGDEKKNQLHIDVYYENATHQRVLSLTENKAGVLVDVFDDNNYHEAKAPTTSTVATGIADDDLDRYEEPQLENVGFEKALIALSELSDKFTAPSLFISKQPGNGAHYVAGIYFEDKLVLFNPIGFTQQKDFYTQLKKITDDYGIEIILNDKEYQNEPTLFNCGPWSLAFVQHLMGLEKSEFDKLWQQFLASRSPENEYNGLKFKHANFDLLVTSLLSNIESDQYHLTMENLRQAHLTRLNDFTLPKNLAQSEQTYLEKRFINTDTHVLVNRLAYDVIPGEDGESDEELRIDDVKEDPAYQSLKKIMKQYSRAPSTPSTPIVEPLKTSAPPKQQPEPIKLTLTTAADFKNSILAVQNKMLRSLLLSRLNRADSKGQLSEYAQQAQKTIQRFCKFIIAMRVIASVFTAFIFAAAYVLHTKRIKADNHNPFSVKALAKRYTDEFSGKPKALDDSPTAGLLANDHLSRQPAVK